jgi:glycosyltransferase involved in cell wall biosynthesis
MSDMAGGHPLLTLFVMAYAQQEHVAEAIAGAFAQTYEPLEIILSDDASPDRTFAIMEEMAAAYSGPHRVILNRNPKNLGITAHIDRIMEISSGALVIQNAGDDISEPDRAAALAEAWLASESANGRRADFVHSSLRRLHPDGRLTPSPVHDHRAMGADATPLDVVMFRHKLVGASAAWTPHLFEAFGPIGAQATVEDYPLAFRAALEGGIAYVDRPLLRHRVGGHSDARLETPAHDNLYGFWLKRTRWHTGFNRAFLADMTGRDFPGRAQAEAECRRRLALGGFMVALADSERGARLTMLPRAVALALRWRTAQPLKDWAKYAFDRLYLVSRGREDETGRSRA